jgi:DNA-binding XRE family transcriptional regulator
MTLKECRAQKGLTQEELARLTNVSVSTIAKAEKKNSCNLETAKKIAEILEKTIEEIFFK